ncbi:MAG: AAA family ATPase, partial [Tepidisphaeraceae bacterium]
MAQPQPPIPGVDPEVQQLCDEFRRDYLAVQTEIAKAIVGHEEIVDGVLTCLFVGGHALLEGVPGLGKTALIRALAEALHLKFSRIQFTPDLMPADVIGTNVIMEREPGRREFSFMSGPIFAQIVLADEINRATPKTQSALLEAMQETSVTIAQQTYR